MADKDTGRTGSGPRARSIDEHDLASEIQGRNELQGNDQEAVRNERRRMPEGRREPLDDADLPDRDGNSPTAPRPRRES